MSNQNNQRIHVTIEGRVQGVGFRQYVYLKANELGIVGWVRNTSSGAVEVTAEGNQDQLSSFMNFLKQGPRSALVTQFSQEWQPSTGEFKKFAVKATL